MYDLRFVQTVVFIELLFRFFAHFAFGAERVAGRIHDQEKRDRNDHPDRGNRLKESIEDETQHVVIVEGEIELSTKFE